MGVYRWADEGDKLGRGSDVGQAGSGRYRGAKAWVRYLGIGKEQSIQI